MALGNNFLQGDVAIATLDTPAANVPTWAILLSQLPAPDAIDAATGTGYHVTIAGYGNNGVGDTGEIGGIDFRRRVAENYIGLLGSLDDLELVPVRLARRPAAEPLPARFRRSGARHAERQHL